MNANTKQIPKPNNTMNQLRTLSIQEPYISLMVHGASHEGIAQMPKGAQRCFIPKSGVKDLEVRSWQTQYRGPLLLHTSRGKEPLSVYEGKLELFPNRGNVVAIADLVDVRRMTRKDAWRACHTSNFNPELFVWELARITPITPQPVIGKVGIFFTELQPKQQQEVKKWLRQLHQ